MEVVTAAGLIVVDSVEAVVALLVTVIASGCPVEAAASACVRHVQAALRSSGSRAAKGLCVRDLK